MRKLNGALARDLRRASSPARARINQWFFKTGPGEYGEGDRFRGITVPALRQLARRYQELPRPEILRLLKSSWHEDRLLALLILVRQHAGGDDRTRHAIHNLYLRNTRWVNNWDLVDSSAEQLAGAHLAAGGRRRLRQLARSDLVWDRRIAIIASFHYIKRSEFEDALAIAELLLTDEHDLIHKAVGWMLREIGKRDRVVEERFLRRHAPQMPRTMLRYAVERFPERLRRRFLRARRVR
jgi:3-methyladenine DNA glycosylase AlkD